MFETLEPLHEMMDKGPQTLKETSFSQAYGNELNEAQKWCKRYKVSNNIKDLNQAWDLYYHVFRRICRQLPQLTTLELQYVSPKETYTYFYVSISDCLFIYIPIYTKGNHIFFMFILDLNKYL